MEAKIEKVKTITAPMSLFDPLAKTDDYITITEWESGEGWQISFNDTRCISLHFSELDAINILSKAMELGFKIEKDE